MNLTRFKQVIQLFQVQRWVYPGHPEQLKWIVKLTVLSENIAWSTDHLIKSTRLYLFCLLKVRAHNTLIKHSEVFLSLLVNAADSCAKVRSIEKPFYKTLLKPKFGLYENHHFRSRDWHTIIKWLDLARNVIDHQVSTENGLRTLSEWKRQKPVYIRRELIWRAGDEIILDVSELHSVWIELFSGRIRLCTRSKHRNWPSVNAISSAVRVWPLVQI